MFVVSSTTLLDVSAFKKPSSGKYFVVSRLKIIGHGNMDNNL
jgi:hypothetical protein